MYAFGRIQWTTGDNSGGYKGLGGFEALAGFNAGDGIRSYTIPGSRTPSIINITYTTNVDIPGTWIFKVGGVFKYPLTTVRKVSLSTVVLNSRD